MNAGHSGLPVTFHTRICHLGKTTYRADKEGGAFHLGGETHRSTGLTNTKSHDGACTCLSGS